MVGVRPTTKLPRGHPGGGARQAATACVATFPSGRRVGIGVVAASPPGHGPRIICTSPVGVPISVGVEIGVRVGRRAAAGTASGLKRPSRRTKGTTLRALGAVARARRSPTVAVPRAKLALCPGREEQVPVTAAASFCVLIPAVHLPPAGR